MDISQKFCVRWNSYKSNLQTAFPKLLTSEHFVDVTLACEKQFIKCHKIVLSACSVYFETLLVNNPCQHPIIFMKDVEFWEIKALVEFMYKGEVNVSQNQLDSLLKSAESLQIRGLSGTKQFVNFEQSEDNREDCVNECKTKRNKNDSVDEDDGGKKKKKKLDEDVKYVQITSVVGGDVGKNIEDIDKGEKVIKHETIEIEDYEYDNAEMAPCEDEDEESDGYHQSVFYPSHNNDLPGPSGISELLTVDDDRLACVGELVEALKDGRNLRKQRPFSHRKEGRKPKSHYSEQIRHKKVTARRSSYKQYTMANMWAALERIEQGLSVYRASLEYGVPRKTLRNWMKKYNIMSYFDLRKQEREKQDTDVDLN